MTYRDETGKIVIVEELPCKCEFCGVTAETRPYGPNGEEVCFDCGMKNEEAAKEKFQAFLDGRARCR